MDKFARGGLLIPSTTGFIPDHEEIIAPREIRIEGIEDIVRVVRCKDCDWYKEDECTHCGICVNPKCGKSWYGCPVPAEHFCSYGERREGE